MPPFTSHEKYRLFIIHWLYKNYTILVSVIQYLPLALSEGPGGYDPERDHEDEEDGAGADRHQGF